MAQKLSIQIALEGGAEIARQLDALGAAGKKAFTEIGRAAEQVGGFDRLDPGTIATKLEKFGLTGAEAIGKISSAVQQAGRLEGLVQGVTQAEQAFGALGKVLIPIGGELRKIAQAGQSLYAVVGPIGVAGVAAFAGITAAITAAAQATIGFADQINKVNNEAIRIGATVERVDQFRAGLEAAGVSAESIGEILKSKLASEQGVKGLEQFITALERMPDGLARSQAATQQFGQAGAELIRILQAGGRLTGFATGKLINDDDARKATELGQAINRLGTSFARMGSVQLAPQLTTGINAVTSAVQALGSRLEQTPWTSFLNAASLGLNPIYSLLSSLNGAFTLLGSTAQQAGQRVQQAGQQAGIGFTTFGTTVQQGTQQATTAFTTFGTVVKQTGAQAEGVGSQVTGMFTQWGTSADQATSTTNNFSTTLGSIPWSSSSSMATAMWNSIIGLINDGINALMRYIGAQSQVGAPVAGGAPAGGPGGGIGSNASGGLLGGRGTGTSDSNLAWLSRGEYIMPARAVRQPGVLSFLESLRRSGRIPGFAGGGLVGGPADAIIDGILGTVNLIDTAMRSFGNRMDSLVRTFVDGLNSSFSALDKSMADIQIAIIKQLEVLSKATGSSKAIVKNARGGLLGGRGTGTSDSNLAWVSRGEHIMPARAVRQPGVLALLEALRRSGGNLGHVLDGMGRFALGGMVRSPMPAFASGGLAGGGHLGTLTLGLPSGGSVSVRASTSVVDQLRKEAALAQVRLGGRKPSRYS